MLKGFRDFLFRGNVIDLAVAVVIGGAFGAIVTALVKDLLTPLIAALVGKPDFSGLTFTINNSQFLYGDFINAMVSFLLIGAAIYFFVVVPMNALSSRLKKPAAPAQATTKKCPECLSEIPLEARRCAHCTAVVAVRAAVAPEGASSEREESQMRMSWLAVIGAPLLALAVFPAMGQQGTGYLKTKVEPGRAGVFIDGKYVGPAANFRIGRKYALAAGEHEVRLSDPRHDEYVTKVTIQAGKTTKLVQTLKDLPAARPPFGRLRTIAGDKFAAVYVNGRYMGHVDEFSNSSQGLLLNPGQYTVKVISAGSEQGHEEQVNIAADSVTIVRAVK